MASYHHHWHTSLYVSFLCRHNEIWLDPFLHVALLLNYNRSWHCTGFILLLYASKTKEIVAIKRNVKCSWFGMAGSYNVLDIYDPSKEYLDIYIFFKKCFIWNKSMKLWNISMCPIHIVLFYFLGNGIVQLRYLNSMNIQRKDVSPLYRFSIFMLKANKFNARHND